MPAYQIFIDGKPRKVEVNRTGERSFTIRLDDKTLKAKLPTDTIQLEGEFSIEIENKRYNVQLSEISRGTPFPVKAEEATFNAEVKTHTRMRTSDLSERARPTPSSRTLRSKQHGEGTVTAPMAGRILSVKVKKGDHVKVGQILCILEAMKMENEITAAESGAVQNVYVSEGSSVSEGEPLFLVT